jgi:hypothetical protein
MNWHDVRAAIVDGDTPDKVGIIKAQEIPSDFIQSLRDEKAASANTRAQEFHRFASIPVAVIEKWLREGFNIYDKNVTAKEIVARLHKEGLTDFLTSSKRL